MKYAVEGKFWDTGHYEVKIKKCADNEKSFSENRGRYDYYFDVFASLEEAETFRKKESEA